ncbi:MAG TPA: arylsulfotransferase family protein [Gaiellaceae bacterium]|nr:arylsulfotransferase family protein [Gaiellaceae bacterium]
MWTRAAFLRRAAGGGVGLLALGGSGWLVDRLAGLGGAPAASESGRRVHVFRSRRDLRPPAVEVVTPARGTAPGYLFLAPSSGPGQRGVLMLDDAGEVVWFHPTAPLTAMNFRAAVYRGEPVLTWWEGKSHDGVGHGEYVVVDAAYRELARFGAAGGLPADLHELVLTPSGTALVTATELRTLDLRRVGGPRRWPVIGSVVQELELPHGRLLFEWRSLDHVPLEESHQTIGPRFDYFHANSVALDADGDLLVSARNTWTVYKLDRGTGAVRWRLGGKRSDFALGDGTFFAWQHDARSHDDGRTISLFDDGADSESQSSALFLRLDTRRMVATLARRYAHRPPLKADKTGSTQLLANGNVLVGWGNEPWLTEFAPDGGVRFDARLPRGGQTYRALRFPWAGRPAEPPALAAVGGAGAPVLYASWNGATGVRAWRLLAGPGPDRLEEVETRPRTGFESELRPGRGSGHAAAVALGAGGEPLGRSAAVAF